MAVLIDNVDQFNNYLPVSVNFSDAKILLFCTKAQQESLEPLFDSSYIDWLIAEDVGSSLSAQNKKVIEHLRNACAALAMVSMLELNNMVIEEGGVTVTETTSRKVASQWRINEARDGAFKHASHALNGAINTIASNPFHADFELWKTAKYTTILEDRFIANSTQWNDNCSMRIDYFTYDRLKHIIVEVQEQKIPLLLGADLYALVINTINNPGATAYPEIVPAIRSYLAHLTVAKAYLDLHLKLTPGGFLVQDTKAATGTINRNSPAADSNLDEFFRNHENRAIEMENRIARNCQLLYEANNSRYSTWESSKFFVDPNAEKPKPVTTTKRYFSGL